ncbi:MAG: hypothetical protein WBO17_09385 [Sphingorhabdus sp.]
MDADTPTFKLREVAIATGWHLGTLRDYFVRGIFQWHEGEGKAVVAGATSRLSLRGAIRLAIAYELWSQGVSPRLAIEAATIFTDFGNTAMSNDAGLTRLSGNLFKDGFDTLLLWRKDTGARIVPAPSGQGIPIAQLFSTSQGERSAVSIVHLDQVVIRVMKELKIIGS